MFNLYLRAPKYTNLAGEECNEGEPLFLYLTYTEYHEALSAKKVLETVYGEGRIEIDQQQEYQARMGRY